MLLDVENLSVAFATDTGLLHAVNGVSLQLEAGQSLGLVGESGCGKSTLGFALMRLLAENGSITGGAVRLSGEDIVRMSEERLRAIRWDKIAMVFQNAMSALSPVARIGDQIANAMRLHKPVSRERALELAGDTFERVGVSRTRLQQYPHEFSGGMKQRAMLALGLVCGPQLLIADEPTTALDVVAQRQVLDLFRDLRRERGLALIMISHDISAVSEICDKVAVMYGGEIMEFGPLREVFFNYRHPYTWALINSFPSLHQPLRELVALPGSPPALAEPPTACPFVSRCPHAIGICSAQRPPVVEVGAGHSVRCHRADDIALAPVDRGFDGPAG
ncbi:ABC transporter ATP-binding protein [Devosia sp.]|uniref:ABC transporter ATP-binding protein n=1 Tax=Devosia sp. TaxID=1871048 RepID=UPI002EE8D29C